MNRVRKRPAVIGIFVLVLALGALTAWIVSGGRNNTDNSGEQEAFVSAVDTAKASIKDGITSSNADDALFIASEQLNTGKTTEARASAEAVSDELLSNDMVKNKYVILLDSYRLENNKEGYRTVMGRYKEVVAVRNDPVLTQETSHLTDAYVDAIFTAPVKVPPEEEVP